MIYTQIFYKVFKAGNEDFILFHFSLSLSYEIVLLRSITTFQLQSFGIVLCLLLLLFVTILFGRKTICSLCFNKLINFSESSQMSKFVLSLALLLLLVDIFGKLWKLPTKIHYFFSISISFLFGFFD
jgi:hypothetical protein